MWHSCLAKGEYNMWWTRCLQSCGIPVCRRVSTICDERGANSHVAFLFGKGWVQYVMNEVLTVMWHSCLAKDEYNMWWTRCLQSCGIPVWQRVSTICDERGANSHVAFLFVEGWVHYVKNEVLTVMWHSCLANDEYNMWWTRCLQSCGIPVWQRVSTICDERGANSHVAFLFVEGWVHYVMNEVLTVMWHSCLAKGEYNMWWTRCLQSCGIPVCRRVSTICDEWGAYNHVAFLFVKGWVQYVMNEVLTVMWHSCLSRGEYNIWWMRCLQSCGIPVCQRVSTICDEWGAYNHVAFLFGKGWVQYVMNEVLTVMWHSFLAKGEYNMWWTRCLQSCGIPVCRRVSTLCDEWGAYNHVAFLFGKGWVHYVMNEVLTIMWHSCLSKGEYNMWWTRCLQSCGIPVCRKGSTWCQLHSWRRCWQQSPRRRFLRWSQKHMSLPCRHRH